jgi:hypothetical protein
MIDKLFLSVGAMKAGTTWLYDKLKQHPDIHFSPQKEVHFLSHYYGHTNILALPKREKRARTAMRRLRAKEKNPKQVRRMRQWYADYKAEPVDYAWFEKIMRPDAEGRYLADFSNLNCFLTPDNWSDAKSNHVKHLRVLYILRDPIKRIWSHFKYHLQFSKHLAAKEPDKDFTLFKKLLHKEWFLRNAFYGEAVNALRSRLSDEQLKITYFEDMVAEPAAFLVDVERFLAIRPFDYPGDLHQRKNTSIRADLPDEWRDYLRNVLRPEFQRLRGAGLWHERWEN